MKLNRNCMENDINKTRNLGDFIMHVDLLSVAFNVM